MDASVDSSPPGLAEQSDVFMEDVIIGLAQSQPEIPCKYLYDERGSELFEAIGKTQEYYVTRADLALHRQHADAIAQRIGQSAHIIEFGSGAGIKIRLLLGAAIQPRAYTPIEISPQALESSVNALQQAFPSLDIQPVIADYTQDIPDHILDLEPPARRRVIYFPGSTISNFSRRQAIDFLHRMQRMVGPSGGLLIGVDLIKPTAVLEAAYNDAEGVTAQFNLNLLERLRTELGASVERADFKHEARFNQAQSRIEMHLIALKPTVIELGQARFEFNTGDSIHTENSYKYSIESFAELAVQIAYPPFEPVHENTRV
ncbi:MAG: L-histidine N(alpha)-methyltransferase [Pseudomonadota bacterium]